MEFFAGYGFNKSHSTTYAWVAYQTAYLKANYPAHFMAALLTIEAANTDKLAMYLGECRDLGVTILPPDINSSELAFTVVDGGVRFGCVRSRTSAKARSSRCSSVRARARAHRLALHPLRARRSAPGQQARARKPDQGGRARFAAAGDGRNRRGAPGAALCRGRQGDRERRPSPARSREGPVAAVRRIGRRRAIRGRSPLPDAPPWTEIQQLAGEKEALGLYMSGHPLDRFSEELKTLRRARASPISRSEADIWVGGIVSGLRPLKTRKGDRMAVFMLDDVAGSVEVVVFPETFGKYGSLIENDAMLLVRGKLEKRRGIGAHRRHRADADRVR